MSQSKTATTQTNDAKADAEFDEYAGDYETALQQGLSVSGESKDFFAEQRILWLAKRLAALGEKPANVIDFGCGTGSATPFLLQHLTVQKVIGVDVSAASLEEARKTNDPAKSQFATLDVYTPDGTLDLAFCNGVFHHIPLAERAGAVDYVLRSLKPGGIFAFWENNPWNPGTRYIMSKIPFDRDAITLTPPEARKLLSDGKFQVLRNDFLFIFPKSLGFLRGLEPPLAGVPIGAQYMVLCRKPG
jgi:SAM-dependent methyltransferase